MCRTRTDHRYMGSHISELDHQESESAVYADVAVLIVFARVRVGKGVGGDTKRGDTRQRRYVPFQVCDHRD
jgi:hypothetical protein